MNYTLSDGSAITFTPVTPGQYRATFKANGEKWELPVIGFAVILRKYENEESDTEIDAVVLADGRAMTVNEYTEGSTVVYSGLVAAS